MDANVGEWLHLGLRWFHIVAAIMWIGSSLFFMWLDGNLERPADPRDAKPGVEGELWMVHSGGFYQVEKKLVAPSEMPRVLHWFKWEAAFTWISGFTLLVVLYYLGGGMLLLDPQVSSIGVGNAAALGIGTLVVSWAIYDALWNSLLSRSKPVATALTVALVIAVDFGLSRVLSGRATYMHVGAMLGTWMVANVWMRILPSQRALVAAVKAGKTPDAEAAKRAKERSRHNNYMTYPVIFIMISNHFPNTFGSSHGWLILIGFFLAGMAVRHYQNTRGGTPLVAFAGIAGAVALAAAVSVAADHATNAAASAGDRARPSTSAKAGASGKMAVVDPATAGSLRVAVRFTGSAPPPQKIDLPGSCQHEGVAYDDKVLVADGKLQNAFVWIAEGLDAWPEPAPSEAIEIDQRGCTYAPRVIGVRVGQPLHFVNSDSVMHNVHGQAASNPDFNQPMPERAAPFARVFDEPEVMVKMKCDVHPWMNAFIGVVAHPFFGVTGPNGELVFDRVPPGEYVVAVWHEVFGRQKRTVTVGAKGSASVEMDLASK